MSLPKKPTKKQLETYTGKIDAYINYLQQYRMGLADAASEGTPPPNGPKNPPKYP